MALCVFQKELEAEQKTQREQTTVYSVWTHGFSRTYASVKKTQPIVKKSRKGSTATHGRVPYSQTSYEGEMDLRN